MEVADGISSALNRSQLFCIRYRVPPVGNRYFDSVTRWTNPLAPPHTITIHSPIMAQFQLPVAAVLVVCSVCSAGLLFIPLESKIQLTADNVSHDPFDVTKPEDIIDGEPVDEASFWRRVRILCICPRGILS